MILNYHDYKAVHVTALLFFIIALVRFHSTQEHGRFFKSFLYISAFMTVSSGVSLMLRWGLDESLPLWIVGKLVIVLALILSLWWPKKTSSVAKFIIPYICILLLVAVVFSIYKPF
jgi:hypothetical protein